MPRLTKSHKEHLSERLRTPEDVAGYINTALEESDAEILLTALRNVADARGVANVAADAGLNRENAYRMLSDRGNPRLSSLLALFDALGIELRFQATKDLKKTLMSSASVLVPPVPDTVSETDAEQVQPNLNPGKGIDYGSSLPPSDKSLAA